MSSAELQLERLAGHADLSPPRRGARVLVIVNPHATTMSGRVTRLVLAALQGRYVVETVDTQRRGHAIELCREAAGEGYDLVVAFGGDGTVNEAANGLAGSATALSLLPGGSNNVLCRILGIPTDVIDATEHLLALADRLRPRRVDLGRVNDRWFTFSAGVGLDASVVDRVDRHPRLKARFGAWYFTGVAVSTFLRRYVVHPPRLELDAGGDRVTGVSAMIQNAHPYTYFRGRAIDLADGAELDSGDLAGVVLTRANPVDLPTVAWRAFSPRAPIRGHRRVAHVAGIGAAVVRSLDGRPIPVQVDGDHVGDEHEARFEVGRRVLPIVA